MLFFRIEDKYYYYSFVSSSMRRKGEKEWKSKIITLLKQDFKNKIPTIKINNDKKGYTKDEEYLPTNKAYGKHKEKTWIEVCKLDPDYIEWLLSISKNQKLISMLSNLINVLP